MNPTTYQKLANRTLCPQPMVAQHSGDLIKSAVLHGCLGIAAEGGELLAEMQRWVWYKKNLSTENVKGELGDVLWYVAEVCNALNLDLGEIMAANIAKLKARYPDKYSDSNAAEENRDRAKEGRVSRTVSEVMTARGTLAGCCSKFPGTPCDCLELAQLMEGTYKEKHSHA